MGADHKAGTRQSTRLEELLFLRAPLGCHAVPDLGCGSLAEPILQGIDQLHIGEAWLNRSGTILAVVLEDEGSRENATKDLLRLFKERGLGFEVLPESDIKNAFTDFISADSQWYRSFTVKELSKEEGQKIADNLVMQFQKATSLDETRSDALRKSLGNILLIFLSMNDRREPEGWKRKFCWTRPEQSLLHRN